MNPQLRVKVSNSLLSDVVTQFIPWDAEASRLRLAAAALQRRPGLVALFAMLATIGGHPETLFFGVIAIACNAGLWPAGSPASRAAALEVAAGGRHSSRPEAGVTLAALGGFL